MPSTSAQFEPPTFIATYFDGRTAQRHAVTVHFGLTALDVVRDDGRMLDQWSYDVVELSDQERTGVRISKRGSEARLVITDPRAFTQLKACAPRLRSERSRTLRNVGLSVVAMVSVVLGGYFSLPILSGLIVELIPLKTEARIGDAYVDEVAALFSQDNDAPLCGTTAGREALDHMVDHLANFTGGPFPYRVDILDTDLVNAVALPGGRILLFRGVLDKAESADEVAGVVAHEMQHVNLRHGMQAMVRSYGVSMLAEMMFGGNFMGNVSSVVMMTSYSRDAEFAADEGAIETLRRAHIGSAGMARFFARLKEQEKNSSFSLPELLSTHPPSAAREALAQAPRGAADWSLSDAQWTALKTICK